MRRQALVSLRLHGRCLGRPALAREAHALRHGSFISSLPSGIPWRRFSTPRATFKEAQSGQRAPLSNGAATAPQSGARATGPGRRYSHGPARVILLLVLTVAVTGIIFETVLAQPENRASAPLSNIGKLSQIKFSNFEIVGREDVSPTAFILTLRWPARNPNSWDGSLGAVISTWKSATGWFWPTNQHVDDPWKHGLWHIEMKEPRVQIAREYTPLPALPSSASSSASDNVEMSELRFLIRKIDGGEMSTYISSLRVGQSIGIRGPFYGFDVAKRLGDAKQIVFIAGGTGVAPALQVASKILDGQASEPPSDLEPNWEKPTVKILWANRRSADCVGRGTAIEQSSLSRLIADLKARHGEHFQVQYFVDDEKKFIKKEDIKAAMDYHPVPQRRQQGSTLPAADGKCYWHSPAVLTRSTDAEDSNSAKDGAEQSCSCPKDATTGRNLVLVSGPDGFIKAFAGGKQWSEGKNAQGPVGGLLQTVIAQNRGSMDDWLVLKL